MRTLAVVVSAIMAGAVRVASVMWVLGCGYVGLGEMVEDRHMAAAAAAFNLGRGGGQSARIEIVRGPARRMGQQVRPSIEAGLASGVRGVSIACPSTLDRGVPCHDEIASRGKRLGRLWPSSWSSFEGGPGGHSRRPPKRLILKIRSKLFKHGAIDSIDSIE